MTARFRSTRRTGGEVPTHRAAAATRRRAERSRDPARRRRLCGFKRVRRSLRDADRRASRAGNAVSSTTASIRRRFARRPEPHCSPAGTTIRSAWASRAVTRRPATTRCGRTRAALAQMLAMNGYSSSTVRQVPRGSVWQTSPLGPFDAQPSGGGGRALLRVHRRRDKSVLPRDVRGNHSGRAR